MSSPKDPGLEQASVSEEDKKLEGSTTIDKCVEVESEAVAQEDSNNEVAQDDSIKGVAQDDSIKEVEVSVEVHEKRTATATGDGKGDPETESGTGSEAVAEVSCSETKPDASELEVLLNHKLRTILSLMDLVSNKDKHPLLLQESTVAGFLVLSLGDEDPEVVERSFNVFSALSKYPENIPTLKKLEYFMDALRCVVRNAGVNDQTRAEAKGLITQLKTYSPPKDPHVLSELSESNKNVMASNANVGTPGASTSAVDGKAEPRPQKPADLNTTMSTMKRKNKGVETILFIENDIIQQKAERAMVTQVLIGVKGIISVTYDLKKNRCIVRRKRSVPAEDFGRAVAALGLANVYLVRKNENKEEVTTLIVATDQENVQYPAYPEEAENEDIDTSTSVARTDQRRVEKGTSIFKSAKNFIQRSFYW